MKKVTGIFTLAILTTGLMGCSSTSPAPSAPSFSQQLQGCERLANIEMQISCIKALSTVTYSDRVEKHYQLAHMSASHPTSRLDFAVHGKELADLMKSRAIHQWPRTELRYETVALLASRLQGQDYPSYSTAIAKVNAGCHPLQTTSFANDNARLVEAYAAASCWMYLSEVEAAVYQGVVNELLDLIAFQQARGVQVTLPNVPAQQYSALPYALFINK